MAHFANLQNNIVVQAIAVNNDVILDKNKKEVESIGIDFCKNLFGGEWIQTSYSGSFRGKFAGIGDFWDGNNFVVQDLKNTGVNK